MLTSETLGRHMLAPAAHEMPSPPLETHSTESMSEEAALLRLQHYAHRRHQRLRSRRIDLAVVPSPYGEQRLLVPSKPSKNLLRRNERACLIIQSHARARAAQRTAGGGVRSAVIADEEASFWRQWLSSAGAEPSGSGSSGNGLPDDPQETLRLQLPLALPHGGAGLAAAAIDAFTHAVRDELCALLALRREQLHVTCPSDAALGGTGGGSGAVTMVQLQLSAASTHPSVGPSQAALTLANLVGGDLNRFQPTSMPPQMVGAGRRLTSSEVRRDRAATPRHAATLATLQTSPHCSPIITRHPLIALQASGGTRHSKYGGSPSAWPLEFTQWLRHVDQRTGLLRLLPGGGTVRVGPRRASGGGGGGGPAKPGLGGSGSDNLLRRSAGVIRRLGGAGGGGGGAASRSSCQGGAPPTRAATPNAAGIAGVAAAAAAAAAGSAAAPLPGQDASRRGGAARGAAHEAAAEGGAASLALTRAARGAASGPPRRDAAREAGSYYALPVRDKHARLPARSLALIESLRRCVPDAPHRSMLIDQTRRHGRRHTPAF